MQWMQNIKFKISNYKTGIRGTITLVYERVWKERMWDKHQTSLVMFYLFKRILRWQVLIDLWKRDALPLKCMLRFDCAMNYKKWVL